MLELRIGGVRVTLTVWFAAFFCWLLSSGVPLRPAWLLGLVAHEAAHLAAARLCGCRARSILLTAGRVRIAASRALLSPNASLFVSAAGPAANLLLAAVFAALGNVQAAQSNLALAAFNLLPVRALDGGEILGNLLARAVKERVAQGICRVASCAAAFAVTTAGFSFLLTAGSALPLASGALLVLAGFFENEYTKPPQFGMIDKEIKRNG